MNHEFIGELAIIGALAVVTTLGLHRIGLPPIAGLLVTGAIAGPHGLGLIGDTNRIEQIAELGVILLLFAIGLEFSLSRLRFIWKAVAVGGSLQVGITTAATLAILMAAGESAERGIVFGLAVALSSTVLVLRVLSGRGELAAPHGRFIVGALIFQDLLVIPLTVLIPVLAGTSSQYFLLDASWALVRATIVVAATLAVAKYLVPRIFRAVDATRTREVFLLAIVAVALGSAWGMNQLGLSFALGAFLAGMLLADTDYGHRATSDIIPLRDAFASFFFISLGMIFDWRVLIESPVLAFLIVTGLVFGKALIASLASLAMRNPAGVAWRSGIHLAQFGEFGYVVLLLGSGAGLIESSEVSLVVTTGVLSILLSRLLMHWAGGLHAGEAMLRPLARLLRARGVDEPTPRDSTLSDHVVIAGYGVAGRLLAQTLDQAGFPYLVLELDTEKVRAGRARDEPVYYGDITSPEAQAHARIKFARVMVLLIDDPSAIQRAVVAAHAESPQLPILARARNLRERSQLLRLGAGHVVCEELESGAEMAACVLKTLGLEGRSIRTELSRALVLTQSENLTDMTGSWIDSADRETR